MSLNYRSSRGAMQARLTSEDGVTLEIGLASVNGFVPGSVTGQASGNQVSYPGVVAGGSTLLSATGTPSAATGAPAPASPGTAGSSVPLPGAPSTVSSGSVATAQVDLAPRQTADGVDARVTLRRLTAAQ
jgi:hypothetical protein